VYRGGVILPGLALMREALLLHTHGVRDVVGAAGSPLAQTTADGVAAGTLFGLAGAIDRILDEQAATLGAAPQVLITGGDAQSLLALLRHVAQYLPDLVLEGVACIANAGDAA
jgi:type III pantothenate kinase